MKKVLSLFVIILGLTLIFLYVFIPDKVRLAAHQNIEIPLVVMERLISSSQEWQKWWPTKNNTNDFTYQDANYQPIKFTYNEVLISVKNKSWITSSTLKLNSADPSTCKITWFLNYPTSKNPFKRIVEYRRLRKIERNMQNILSYLKTYAEDEKNVYGINIQHEKIQDTLVAIAQTSSSTYPTTQEIYRLINHLQTFSEEKKIRKAGYPMLSIIHSNNSYRIMTAVPVKKRVTETSDIAFRRLVPGNVLITEIKGGTHSAEEALRQLSNYVHDMRHSSPAIPFQTLITNRLTEPDTNKWLTQLNYPIF